MLKEQNRQKVKIGGVSCKLFVFSYVCCYKVLLKNPKIYLFPFSVSYLVLLARLSARHILHRLHHFTSIFSYQLDYGNQRIKFQTFYDHFPWIVARFSSDRVSIPRLFVLCAKYFLGSFENSAQTTARVHIWTENFPCFSPRWCCKTGDIAWAWRHLLRLWCHCCEQSQPSASVSCYLRWEILEAYLKNWNKFFGQRQVYSWKSCVSKQLIVSCCKNIVMY